MDWKSEIPGTLFFSIILLKNKFCSLKTPAFFRNLLGDHFARVESSGDQNLTKFILDFAGSIQVTKLEKYFCENYGRIWSYRALVKAILRRTLRSIIWALSQGARFCRGRGNLGFSWFCGSKNGKKHENTGSTWSDFGLRSSRPS